MNGSVYDGSILEDGDHCCEVKILSKFENQRDLVVNELIVRDKSLVAVIDNVLSSEQCFEIISNVKKCTDDRYDFSKRFPNASIRVGVVDEAFSKELWKALSPVVAGLLEKSSLSEQPLGFDVVNGQWFLNGLSDIFHIKGELPMDSQLLMASKSAQYCPDNNQRSLLTLLIQLNDDFDDGETTFYFQGFDNANKNEGTPGNDLKINENGSIKRDGCNDTELKVKAEAGRALLFTKDVLHQLNKFRGNSRFIMRADVMVKRENNYCGFDLNREEREDYKKCLDYRFEALGLEVRGDPYTAAALYDEALSIRYSYPRKRTSKVDMDTNERCFIFPDNVWYNIFNHLDCFHIENVVRAFPGLHITQKAWELRKFIKADQLHENESLFIPTIVINNGMIQCFKFRDEIFFNENKEACLRVAAMYAFYLFGHSADDSFYTVRYNPENQTVYGKSLKDLLADAFYNRSSYGAVYAVDQRDRKRKDIEEDFKSSVDRSYMSIRHEAQFVGVSLSEQLDVNVRYPHFTEDDVINITAKDVAKATINENEDSTARYILYQDDNGEYIGKSHRIDFKKFLLAVIFHDLGPENGLPKQMLFLPSSDSRCGHVGSFSVVVKEILRYRRWKMYFDLFRDAADIDINNWMNGHLIWKNRLVACSNDPNTTHDILQFIYKDISTVKELYQKSLQSICSRMPGMSAALVSIIKSPVCIPDNAICLCSMAFTTDDRYLGGGGFRMIEEAFKSKCFNHLVFDFTSHKMNVRETQFQADVNLPPDLRSTENDPRETDCIFYNGVYLDFYKAEIEPKLKDVFSYVVDVVPISKNEESGSVPDNTPWFADGYWDWDPCRCKVPGFEIHKCHIVRDYPAIDHIHMIGGENRNTNDVIVWTAYGGLASV